MELRPTPFLRVLRLGNGYSLLHHAQRGSFLICTHRLAEQLTDFKGDAIPRETFSALRGAGLLESPDVARKDAVHVPAFHGLILNLGHMDIEPQHLDSVLSRCQNLPGFRNRHVILSYRAGRRIFQRLAAHRDRIEFSFLLPIESWDAPAKVDLSQLAELNIGLLLKIAPDQKGPLPGWLRRQLSHGSRFPMVFHLTIDCVEDLREFVDGLVDSAQHADFSLNVSLGQKPKDDLRDFFEEVMRCKQMVGLLAEWELPLERLLSAVATGVPRFFIYKPTSQIDLESIMTRLEDIERNRTIEIQLSGECNGCGIEGFCQGRFIDNNHACQTAMRQLSMMTIQKKCSEWLVSV